MLTSEKRTHKLTIGTDANIFFTNFLYRIAYICADAIAITMLRFNAVQYALLFRAHALLKLLLTEALFQHKIKMQQMWRGAGLHPDPLPQILALAGEAKGKKVKKNLYSVL